MQYIFVSSLQKGIIFSKFTYTVSSVLHFQMSLKWAKKVAWTLPKNHKDCAEGPSRHLLEINYASTIFWFLTKPSKGAKAQTTRHKGMGKHHPQLHSQWCLVWPHVTHGKSLLERPWRKGYIKQDHAGQDLPFDLESQTGGKSLFCFLEDNY